VVAIFTYKPLRIVQNFFIISLSVADMAVALLVMPFHVSIILYDEWIFGFAFCDMWLTFDIMLCTASILNLCVIALDRYFAIHDPLSYAQKRTLSRMLVMVCAAWLTSGAISVPPLFGWNDKTNGSLYDADSGQCHLTDERSYVIYSACGSFYIPLCIMSFVYLKIFMATRKRLRERARASAASRLPMLRNTKSNNIIYNDPGSEVSTNDFPMAKDVSSSCTPETPKITHNDENNAASNNSSASGANQSLRVVNNNQETSQTKMTSFFEQKQRISLSKERRAARTLGFIMGAFVVCWLPFFMFYVIVPFCPECVVDGSSSVEIAVVILGYVNSTLNPIIYTIFNKDFQRAFHAIYVKMFRCRKRLSSTTIQLNGRTMV